MSTWWRGPNRLPGVIVAVSACALVWSRLLPITQSLWTDEIHSVRFYIDPGPAGIFGHYIANDHVLFELLAWAWTGVIGDHSEAAYRFWGVAPALAGGLLLTWWLWRRLGPWVAAVFSLLAVASPLYYTLSIEARGYGLGFLAATLMLIGADGFVRQARTRELGLFVAGALIGIWTLPVFVLPFVAATGLLLARARPHARRLLRAAGFVCVLSLLFYAPVLGGVLHASKQTFGPTLPWYGFATGAFRDLLAPEVLVLTRGVASSNFAALGPGVNGPVAGTGGWPLLVAAVVVLAGVCVAFAARERFLGLMLVVPALFTYTALDLGRLHVVNRFASFLLLPLLVTCALALVALGRRIAGFPRGRAPVLVLVAGLSLLVLARTDTQLKLSLAEPYENPRTVAEVAAGAHLRSVLSNVAGGNAAFYLGGGAISSASAAQLESLFCSGAGQFVYLQERFGSAGPSTTCLRARGAVRIPVAERHALAESPASAPVIAWVTPAGSGSSSVAPPVSLPSDGRVVGCRPLVRAVEYSDTRFGLSGRPVAVSLPASGGHARVALTMLHAGAVGSITGAGEAAGQTFTASGGFVTIEYELENHGPGAVVPERTVSRLLGLTGDFGGTVQQAGSSDPGCQPAEPSFAAARGLADPDVSVSPGRQVKTVAVYPLARLTPVTGYVLAWSSASPRVRIALPRMSP